MASGSIEMKADDSAMVDDILNELNQTSDQNLDQQMISNSNNITEDSMNMMEDSMNMMEDTDISLPEIPDEIVERNNPPVNVSEPNITHQHTHINHVQMPPQIINQSINNHDFDVTEHPHYHQEIETEPPMIKNMISSDVNNVDVAYSNNESKINKILNTMKKPAIVIILSFLLFHPFTIKLLARIFPTIYKNNSFVAQNLRILCLSLILGLSFLLVTSVMKI